MLLNCSNERGEGFLKRRIADRHFEYAPLSVAERFRGTPFRNVAPLDENAGDLTGRIDHRLVDEIDEMLLRSSIELIDDDRRSDADMRFPAGVHAVQELVESLAGDLR